MHTENNWSSEWTYHETFFIAKGPKIDIAILSTGDQHTSSFSQIQACHLLSVCLYLIYGGSHSNKQQKERNQMDKAQFDQSISAEMQINCKMNTRAAAADRQTDTNCVQ